jgi:hypothetical protein
MLLSTDHATEYEIPFLRSDHTMYLYIYMGPRIITLIELLKFMLVKQTI